jgi:predicted nucleic-acid-binding protein
VIGLDTNILLRFILRDDAVQSPRASALLQKLSTEEPGWVTLVTIVEMVWVLSRSKGLHRTQIAEEMERLLDLDHLMVERGEAVRTAFACYRTTHADFADCLIAASARAVGCTRVVTFDRVAARDTGMELLAG